MKGSRQTCARSWLNAGVSSAACFLVSWTLKPCAPAIVPLGMQSQMREEASDPTALGSGGGCDLAVPAIWSEGSA